MSRARQTLFAVGMTVCIAVAGTVALAVTIRSAETPVAKLNSPATQPSFSVALVLSTRTVKAGGEIPGQIVVENRTGHDINRIGCHGLFQVLLASSTYMQDPVWPACAQRITIPTGHSSLAVHVSATYTECGQLGPIGSVPACVRGSGMPPLPPGEYLATTFEDGNAIPLPAPVKVTVT